MKPRIALAFLLLAASALACNLPSAASTALPTAPTEIALTVAASVLETASARATLEDPSAQTATLIPTHTPVPTGTPPPAVLAPASTRSPASPTAQPCDEASFIQDVTVPDGTKFRPGEAFTKTWRLRNVGTCAWREGYAVAFVSGETMGAPAVVNLRGEVMPGETVDIAVEMKAPANPGRYTGYWKMRNLSGATFGVSGIDQPFYVEIEVIPVTPTVTVSPGADQTGTVSPPAGGGSPALDLAEAYCQAEWRSQRGTLDCPGITGDAWGYVQRMDGPRLETSAEAAAPALLTFPDTSANGAITGRYPALTVRRGDRFRAEVGCLHKAEKCSVVFQLNYIVGDQPAQNLGQWAHRYTGALETVNVDLSPLAGQNVQIILAVLSGGSSEGDQAVWVNPRIDRP
jgi:hypothetical protein